MGRKKPEPQPEPDQPTKTTTKVSVALLRKAKMVSTYKDIDLYDYLESVLRPAVEADYDRMIREEAK